MISGGDARGGRGRGGLVPALLLLGRALSPRTRAELAAVSALTLAGRACGLLAAALFALGRERGAVVAAAGAGVAYFLRRVLLTATRVEVECDLHRSVARALLSADVLEVPASEPHVAVFDGTYNATGWLASELPSMAADVLASVLAIVTLAAFLPPRLLVTGAVAAAVVLAAAFMVRARTHDLQRRAVVAYQALADAATTAIEGRLEAVAAAREQDVVERVSGAAAHYGAVAKRTAFGAALLGRVPLAAGAVAFTLALALDAESRGALAPMAAATALVVAASVPILGGVVLGAQDLSRTLARVEPLLALLRRPARPEIERARAGASGPAPVMPAGVAFDRVAFAYEAAAHPALRDATFAWPAGTTLVLRGPNGSGKSTALRLALGLREPDAGEVRVDGAALATLDVVALRRATAYLPQRPYLGEAHASVRDAFRLLRGDASDDAIKEALARTGLLEPLRARHPEDPLSCRVGELSAGQRQRAALARVLALDAKLVLLDEPDANLDEDGVALVASLVEELAREGRMVAVAAHARELAPSGALTWELAEA